MRQVQLFRNLAGYHKLSPAQKDIVNQWDLTRLTRKGLFYKLRAARSIAEKIAVLDEIQGTVEAKCPHDIEIDQECKECDLIEDICLGEFEPLS